jgi:clan AA aspartic protease (TIGR02281 family)
MKHSLFLILTFVGLNMMAQNRPESYNYQRGLEAMQNEKTEEALDYFNKDLKENPKNGYSYSWIALLRKHEGEYGKALTAADLAIKNLPKKDVEYVVFAYATRADIYLNLEDTVKAIADYTTAIKFNPEQSSLYDKRAQIYYEQDKYDLADADYQKMIDLEPGGTMGYMGKGRNANAQEKWEEAIKYFDYVTKLASDYCSAYSFRAESYLGLKKWNEATDDLITALSLEWDNKALYLLSDIEEPALTMLVAKMKVQAAKFPNEIKWPYILGGIYEQNNEHAKALKAYTNANTKDPSPLIWYRIAKCQVSLGDYSNALNSIESAINMDSTDVDYLSYKANIYYEMGEPELAINEWDKVINLNPDYGWGYYRRGWFKQLIGQFDDAIEDLSMAIVLEPNYTYSYSSRGDIYMKQGKRELAEADFNKIIEMEDSPEKYECIQYAYQGLGQYDKAMAAMDSIIARDTTDAGSYYDAACVYCKMGKNHEALAFLAKSLEKGYNRFAHIERDSDLDPIRNSDEFKRLIENYKSQPPKTSQTYSAKDETISEVPFVKENGVYKVQCKVNGLPLHFVFDTGASDVTLSLVEANFMMKNGYLSGNDVIGSQKFMDANGDVSVGTIINIKDVTFGDFNLNNFRATVVRNQRAPLLLGQSVLARLGKIEIDNPGRVLKITHQKEKNY